MLSKLFEMVEYICSKTVVPTYPVSLHMESELKKKNYTRKCQKNILLVDWNKLQTSWWVMMDIVLNSMGSWVWAPLPHTNFAVAFLWRWPLVMCLAASTTSITTVAASSISTSGQTFQIAAASGLMTGNVITAKLPLPANSKIVTVNVPTTQGGRAGLCPYWHAFFN